MGILYKLIPMFCRSKGDGLEKLRSGLKLSGAEQFSLIVTLSFPAILAQLSSMIMSYIDASMVGRLGAVNSASIGLMSSTLWLFWGIDRAITSGFSIQIAQLIGAKRDEDARNVMKSGLVAALLLSLIVTAIGALLSRPLPLWLGANSEVARGATTYIFIYMLSMPAFQMMDMATAFIQASGNIRVPSILSILMCVEDVLFNFLLIFPTRKVGGITIPGLGLGVAGAALGTALSFVLTAILLLIYMLFISDKLHIRRGEKAEFRKNTFTGATRIGIPVLLERIAMNGAQVVCTSIVAPLGTIAIAANSFALTAESLCYLPGFGVREAAGTLIGQSIGAGRMDMARRLGWMSTLFGMLMMGMTGILLFIFCPWMIGLLTTDTAVRELAVHALRVECYAEPFYGASIVAWGVFRGAGYVVVPTLMIFVSMWFIRIPLMMFFSPRFGLGGFWFAMGLELVARGTIFLFMLKGRRWQKKAIL